MKTLEQITDGWLKAWYRAEIKGSSKTIRNKLRNNFLECLKYARAITPQQEQDILQHKYNVLNMFSILNKPRIDDKDALWGVNIYQPLTERILYR